MVQVRRLRSGLFRAIYDKGGRRHVFTAATRAEVEAHLSARAYGDAPVVAVRADGSVVTSR